MDSPIRRRYEKSGAEMKTGAWGTRRRRPVSMERDSLVEAALTVRADQIHDLDVARIGHFRIRQHLQLRQAAAQEAREHRRNACCTSSTGAKSRCSADGPSPSASQSSAYARGRDSRPGLRTRPTAPATARVRVRVEAHHLHVAGAGEPLLRDRAAGKRKTHAAVRSCASVIFGVCSDSSFENRAQIANRHAFFEQVCCSTFAASVSGSVFGTRSSTGDGVSLLHRFRAACTSRRHGEQFGRMRDHRGDSGFASRPPCSRLDHRVAVHLRLASRRTWCQIQMASA